LFIRQQFGAQVTKIQMWSVDLGHTRLIAVGGGQLGPGLSVALMGAGRTENLDRLMV
jgi:hypothetical protein